MPAKVKATHNAAGATEATILGLGSSTKLNMTMTSSEKTRMGVTISRVRLSRSRSFQRTARMAACQDGPLRRASALGHGVAFTHGTHPHGQRPFDRLRANGGAL